jgi:FtsZ-interacting cell division protein ZipA
LNTWIWIVIAVAVVVVVVALLWAAAQRRRGRQLKDRFGPEYDRTVEEKGKRQAYADLETREKRREELEIRPLPDHKRESYAKSWREIQTRFVNDPQEAVNAADTLVTTVMQDRGYPMEGFEQRAEDVSVDHPEVVSNYRTAHAIAASSQRGQATTEDLRQATVHYRALFEELLQSR